MRIENGIKYLTISEVSKRVGRSLSTIKNWYEWYNMQPDDVKAEAPLPEMRTDLDIKGTRYFNEAEIYLFEEFKKGRTYGKMAEVSRKKWGNYR